MAEVRRQLRVTQSPRTLGKFNPVGKQKESANHSRKTTNGHRQKPQALGGLETATTLPRHSAPTNPHQQAWPHQMASIQLLLRSYNLQLRAVQ